MFHRSAVSCLAAGVMLGWSAGVSATEYQVGIRDDVVAVDGFCSLREAVLAVNTRRGHIAGAFSDERVLVAQTSAVDLTTTARLRNVSNSSQEVRLGERLFGNDGDLIEYRITVRADNGDANGVTLAYSFPEDASPGWQGALSNYVADSAQLNGEVIDDGDGVFPFASPSQINSPDGVSPGLIANGETAEVIFRVRLEGREDPPVSADFPLEEGEEFDYLVEAECPAGTQSNTVLLAPSPLLEESDPAPLYQLISALEIGGLAADGSSLNPTVTISVAREDSFDTEPRKNVVLRAADDARVLRVRGRATLTLNQLDVQGGASGPLPADENGRGGLILNHGILNLQQGTLLSGGQAVDGGAVYLVVDPESGLAGGARSLSFTNARFENNNASGDGGALATAATFVGPVNGSLFHFQGNSAGGDGGAIFLDGAASGHSLQLTNGTFYNNQAVDGSAIRLAGANRLSQFNNVTVAGNNASGSGAISYSPIAGGGGGFDIMQNSAVLGNINGDCVADDGPAVEGDGSTLDLARIDYTVSNNLSCGPLDAQFFSDDPAETIDYSLADFSLLTGDDGAGAQVVCDGAMPGPAGCTPFVFDDSLIGFLPANSGGSRPFGEPSLVGFGSPEDSVVSVCEATDQRESDRTTRCDAGSVELQIAGGTIDEFILVQGREVLLDVLANDLGDLLIDCSVLADPALCIDFFQLPLRTAVAPTIDVMDGVRVLVAVPDREGVFMEPLNGVPEPGDVVRTFPAGYPLVRLMPSEDFQGVDQFRYFVDSTAISGPVFAGANPSAGVNLVVEAESGLTRSDGIGSFGMPALLTLLLLAGRCLHRVGRRLLIPLMLAAAPLQAAEIVVNSTADLRDTDGQCTLREAIDVSIDNSPLFAPDCSPGATGRDTILIEIDGADEMNPAIIELDPTLGELIVSESLVTIQGQGPGVTIIRAADDPGMPGQGLHRIFQAQSSMTLQKLTLENGWSADRGGAIFTTQSLVLEDVEVRNNASGDSAGAIFLSFNSDLRRTVTIDRSYFHDNIAANNGGVLSMVAQNQRHDIEILASTFENNAASNAGGALDINLPFGGTLNIANSTFVGNSAAEGGAVDLRQLADTAPANIMNSVFVDTAGAAAGAIELGDDDPEQGGRLLLSHSIYVDSGNCSTSTPPNRLTAENVTFSVFSTPRDATCQGSITEQNNSETNSADIRDVLNAGVLVPASFDGERYLPPHFPIPPDAPSLIAAPLIIDAGNNIADLASGVTNPTACRDEDLRGSSRESGGRCDIGTFELQVTTAIDDEQDNSGRSDRLVVIDVLDNDLPGDGVLDMMGDLVDNRVLRGTIDLSDGTNPPGATLVHRGSWTFDHSDVNLSDGEHLIVASVFNADNVGVTNARQTVFVRASGVADEEDEFVVTATPELTISSIDGDTEGDFVVDDGRLIINGTSIAEPGSEVEIFIDNVSQGRVPLVVDTGTCGGAAGTPTEDDDCLVQFDPGPLTCNDLEDGGAEFTINYQFSAFNDESMAVSPSTAATITATVQNLAPRFEGETRRSQEGRVEVFELDVEDPDGGPIPISNLTLSAEPNFARQDFREVEVNALPEFRQLVFGIEGIGAIDPDADDNDPNDGIDGFVSPGVQNLGLVARQRADGVIEVTYTPRDIEGRFDDTFTLQVVDDCGADSSAAFRVTFPPVGRNSASIGVIHGGFLFLLLLMGWRRQAGQRGATH